MFTTVMTIGLIPCLFLLGGCQHNPLKTNSKSLAAEILQDEASRLEADRAEKERRLADTLNKLPAGFRFAEDRSPDPQHQPVTINIAGNLNNIRNLRLSDVARSIRYIPLETPPDSSFSRVMKFRYVLTPDYIIAINPSGILLYSREGKYITTIVKNEFTGIRIEKEMMVTRSDHTFVGAGLFAKTNENTLFYSYRNTLTGQRYIMEYDCSRMPLGSDLGYDPENPTKIRALGEVVIDLNGRKPPEPAASTNARGMWSASPEYLYNQLGVFLLDRNTYLRQTATPYTMGNAPVLAVFSVQGDTLATFRQQETIHSWSKPNMRGTDPGCRYERNGNLYFREAYSDTVFRIIPPNRMLPVWVLNLGSYKLSRHQGLDPDANLQGKIIPESWAETGKYLFLTFTKDSYDCPNTRKNRQLNLYYALYNKSTYELIIIRSDPKDYDSEILLNDLDGGTPVWPESYMIGNGGDILISLKGGELKERVLSEAFRLSSAPAEKKEKLAKLAESIDTDTDVLMIIE
ncbi:MAG: DUF4933 domain-containing protein [Bacteroidales bacterium]|nr:DUF4933 domain-containing protein [Bacteroidales bacterium]